MKIKKSSGMTLVEMMFVVALFSVVMLITSQSVLKGMSVWRTNMRNTTLNFQLQQVVNNCFSDGLKAKASRIVVNHDSSLYDTVKIQMPVSYTSTGAEGVLGNYILYTVKTLDGQLSLFRQICDSSDNVLREKVIAIGLDNKLDTTKTATDDLWKQKSFAVKKVDALISFYIRMLAPDGRTRELETKVSARN